MEEGEGEGEEKADSRFERYTPQHPLPEGILKMKPDQTVCHYCGVSYLIHREIKALETKITQLEAELKRCAGAELREKKLLQQVQDLMQERSVAEDRLQKAEEAKKTAVLTDAQLKTRTKELQESRTHLKRLESDISELNQYISDLSITNEKFKKENIEARSKVKGLVEIMHSLKKEVVSISKTAAESKNFAEKKFNEFQQCMQKVSEAHQTELNKMQLKTEHLEEDMKRFEDLNDVHVKLQKAHAILQREAVMANEMLSDQKDVHQCNNIRIAELERKLESYQEKSHESHMESNEYKNQLKNMKSVVEELNNQLEKKEQNLQTLIQKNQTEVHELQQSLLAARRKGDNLQLQQVKMQRENSEVKRKHQASAALVDQFKDSEKKLRSEIESLKKERNMTTTAHQVQISELKTSFRTKLQDIENFPLKLETALQKERHRNIVKIEKLKEELTQNFNLTLEIEKNKYQNLLDKYQEDKLNIEDVAKKQKELAVKSYIDAINDLEEILLNTRNASKENEIALKNEINDLKKIIMELEQRLATSNEREGTGTSKLSAELSGKQQEFLELGDKLKLCEQQLAEAESRIEELQKTVHLECKERFELSQSLTDARTQLLQLKTQRGAQSQTSDKPGSGGRPSLPYLAQSQDAQTQEVKIAQQQQQQQLKQQQQQQLKQQQQEQHQQMLYNPFSRSSRSGSSKGTLGNLSPSSLHDIHQKMSSSSDCTKISASSPTLFVVMPPKKVAPLKNSRTNAAAEHKKRTIKGSLLHKRTHVSSNKIFGLVNRNY
ncbi:leucine-, glutamate- and lysine-rich protein 1-like [Argonauta hians]